MRIVIVGGGKVGFALAEQLTREGHDIVVIDSSKKVLGDCAERLDVITIEGNGASLRTQRGARTGESDLLIAATASDELNLMCCIVAKKLGCARTIARVRNPDYTEQIRFLKEEMGLSMAINPERNTAMEIYRMLRFPSFLKRDTFAKGRAQIVEVLPHDDFPYFGKPLYQLSELSRIGALICAVKRGEEVFIPDGRFCLQPGDKIYATAPTQNQAGLVKLLGVDVGRIKSVMIVGGSRIAFYLADQLLSTGIEVHIIERDPERCVSLADKLPHAVIINADGSDQQVLRAEGIAECDAMVTLTNMDEENLIISMYAHHVGVPKVVTKINRVEYIDVFRDRGIDSVVSPKLLTADGIVRYVRSMYNAEPEAMLALYRLADGLAEAMEFIATAHTDNLGRTLREITLKPNILIACIVREGEVIIPRGDDRILEDDSVFVVAAAQHKIAELNDIFRAPEGAV